jgi:hypothetical protein
VVAVDGVNVGYMEKYANTRTEIHPWKVWHLSPVTGQTMPESFRVFYEADGGKKAAVAYAAGAR